MSLSPISPSPPTGARCTSSRTRSSPPSRLPKKFPEAAYTSQVPAVEAGCHLDRSVQRIEVNLGNRSYPIYIGAGAMQLKAELDRAISARDILLVTNTTVGPLYAAKLT